MFCNARVHKFRTTTLTKQQDSNTLSRVQERRQKHTRDLQTSVSLLHCLQDPGAYVA